jgi:hypothetical protein
MMGFLWFWLVAVMIVGYVVLDGFDLGVGVLHLFLVRTEAGMATKSGSWPAVARFTSLSRCSTPRPSAVFICRS